MKDSELEKLLNRKYLEFNCEAFIKNDPVSIPHLFSRNEDIEVAGFLTSVISWGQRATILKNATKLMSLMDNSPYDFILNFSRNDELRFKGFIHRTFKDSDLLFFVSSLKRIISRYGSLEEFFTSFYLKTKDLKETIIEFRNVFLATEHLKYTERHVPNVLKGSAAKRINMFLRWMVRKDLYGVDFGIWGGIPASALYIPLDVHTARVGRELGLLKRKSNDWKAVEELTNSLKKFDNLDPVKYDFAIFGMGVNKEL